MLEDTTIHNAITDKALASYFRSSGNLLEEESAVLGQAVTNLMLSGDNVNNKNIILSLILDWPPESPDNQYHLNK
ncbi:hypothetical protein F3181_08660 [Escherichia coli]|nr:hypothetical protein [Escherichia coli]